MKTSKDPRHKKRIKAIQDLFAWEFHKSTLLPETAKEVVKNIKSIDKLIKQSAPSWPVAQINKIDLCILRLAVFELAISADAPYKVVVDEAVELAKEFGSESSPAFINGALGKLIINLKLDLDKKPQNKANYKEPEYGKPKADLKSNRRKPRVTSS